MAPVLGSELMLPQETTKPFFPFRSSFLSWPEIAVPTTPPGQWERSLKEKREKGEQSSWSREQSFTGSPQAIPFATEQKKWHPSISPTPVPCPQRPGWVHGDISATAGALRLHSQLLLLDHVPITTTVLLSTRRGGSPWWDLGASLQRDVEPTSVAGEGMISRSHQPGILLAWTPPP